MNLFIPIFLIAVSIITFFMYIDPMYQGTSSKKGIKELLVVKEEFDKKRSNVAKINKMKTDLRAQYNLIAANDLERIKKMLPDHMDNVKLIVDIQRIGYDAKNNIRLGDISLSKMDTGQKVGNGEIKIIENKGYDSVLLNFSFTTSYGAFKRFLEDLHKSLRLVDVAYLNVLQEKDKGVDGVSRLDNYKITISLRTYWINNNNLE